MQRIIYICICVFILNSVKSQEFDEFEIMFDDTTQVIPDTEFSLYIPETPYDSIIAFGKTYLGLPYRTTVRAPWPLDCSGFVSMIFLKYGYNLPRSSADMAEVVPSVPFSEVQVGDLLFFRGRDSRKGRVGHVSMVIEVRDNDVLMMHSTTSKGIIIEPYPDSYYYKQRFVKVGRVVQKTNSK